MPFDNPSNHSRVQKMLQALDHIETSKTSNRTSAEDVAALLAPVRDKIADLAGSDRPETSGPAGTPDVERLHRPPMQCRYANIRDVVERAPIEELPQAMASIMTRLDEVIHEAKPKDAA